MPFGVMHVLLLLLNTLTSFYRLGSRHHIAHWINYVLIIYWPSKTAQLAHKDDCVQTKAMSRHYSRFLAMFVAKKPVLALDTGRLSVK